ncbi:acyl carrier protein [Pseudomonas alcaligenes]|uniref:Acyl carrier protein n=1 Tax=Aquipseudomonas alcaligenes TaxID=43263 RepID=A0ABR7S5M7_AQUAC|nr:acyl carrier protein [Pseudomonas alcaligenes]MBC9251896.1 acyl carrier protein [Pseudomonas alcaligenes]
MDKQLQDVIGQRRAVLDKLKDSLIDRLNLYQTRTQIDDDTPLFGSGLKLDSVDATELVVMLDEEFGVRVSEGDDPSYMRNVNSLASFILKRQAAAAA